MNKSDVAREYRQKHGPDMPTAKLARIMYKESKLIYNSVEDARDALRYIEGKRGAKLKSQVSDASFIMNQSRDCNPYKLPKSEETEYKPFFVKGKDIGILSDIHAPYHNIKALTAAIDFLKGVDTVIINGDLFDFHGISRYMKDPRKKSFSYELDCGADVIKKIQDALNCKVIFKLGNHDERYQHYLWQKAGEIADVEDFQLYNLLVRRGCKIEMVDDKRIVKAGGLNIVHGHEFPSGITSPVNIARGLYLRGKTSSIAGHHHRTSEHTEQDMNGKITTTWSVGCLCELHPQYMPLNSWNHGVARVHIDGKDFHMKNHRIYNGKIL